MAHFASSVKKVTVLVAFEIPAAIITAFTNSTSTPWVTAQAAGGHFGIGPADQFTPIWYAADSNSR